MKYVCARVCAHLNMHARVCVRVCYCERGEVRGQRLAIGSPSHLSFCSKVLLFACHRLSLLRVSHRISNLCESGASSSPILEMPPAPHKTGPYKDL